MKELDKNITFETMLGDLSAKLVNLPFESINAGIVDSMNTLVEFFDADSCHLGKISDDLSKIIISIPARVRCADSNSLNPALIWVNTPTLNTLSIKTSEEKLQKVTYPNTSKYDKLL
jgi:hypothetical protein